LKKSKIVRASQSELLSEDHPVSFVLLPISLSLLQCTSTMFSTAGHC